MVWVFPVPGGPYSSALAGRLTELAQLCAMLHEVQDIAIEQLQCRVGQDHVGTLDRRQLVNRQASRRSAIIRAAVE